MEKQTYFKGGCTMGQIETFPSEKELKKLKKKAERREKYDRFKQKLNQAWTWCIDNPEKAIPIGVAVGGGIAKGAKTISRHAKLKEERELKDLYIYDRSTGFYWKLKKPLTSRQQMEINLRKTNGEKLGDILNSMRVLN
jgi:ABC-type nitrate/sulfonate/bicarbonate transport system substrate-binding protein